VLRQILEDDKSRIGPDVVKDIQNRSQKYYEEQRHAKDF